VGEDDINRDVDKEQTGDRAVLLPNCLVKRR